MAITDKIKTLFKREDFEGLPPDAEQRDHRIGKLGDSEDFASDIGIVERKKIADSISNADILDVPQDS